MLLEKKKEMHLFPNHFSESFYIEKKIHSILKKKSHYANFLISNQLLLKNKKKSFSFKKKPYSSYIESVLQNQTENQISLNSYSINDALKSASTIAFLIAKKLESKGRFPKIKRELFDQVQKCNFIEGIRISCSGSLKGGKMAQTKTYKMGATSLQVFSKKVDYHFSHALTKYGSLGVKVWVSYK